MHYLPTYLPIYLPTYLTVVTVMTVKTVVTVGTVVTVVSSDKDLATSPHKKIIQPFIFSLPKYLSEISDSRDSSDIRGKWQKSRLGSG